MLRWIVVLGLRLLNVPLLVEYVRSVITAMTDNPFFSNPPFALALLTTANEELDAAYQASQGPSSGPKTTALLRSKRFAVVSLLNYLAAYVEFTGNEDHEIGDVIILSANMGVRAFPINTGRSFEVLNLPLPGEVVARTRSEDGAVYEWQHTGTPNDENSWTPVPATNVASTIIKGLPSVTKMYFRVRVNKGGTVGPWQGPVSLVIN